MNKVLYRFKKNIIIIIIIIIICWLRPTDRKYQSLPELIFFFFLRIFFRELGILGIRDFILYTLFYFKIRDC